MSFHSGTGIATAIVIGGGVVGACCALELQRRGIATTIIDEGSTIAAPSRGNAGHIAIEQVEPLASLATLRALPRRLFSAGGALALPPAEIRSWLPFSLRLLAASRPSRFRVGHAALRALMADALPAWRRLLHRCHASNLLIERGHFIVWESERAAARARAAWARADTGQAHARAATPHEIQRLSTIMRTPPAGAIRFEGTGQIEDLDLLAAAIERAFLTSGGSLVRCRAKGLGRAEGLERVVCDDGVERRADAILVAAGIGSARLMQRAGYRVPMIAERGYHLHSEDSEWPLDMPPVVFEERSMIVTRFLTGVRAASFVEFCSGEGAADPGKWRRLRRHIAELGVPFHEPMLEWSGARPTLPDYLPAMGRCVESRNLFYAFGHQHLGLTLAATSAEAVGSMVAGEAPNLDLSPFDLKRFQGK